ncbi:unnamed protein product [Ceratitis capitata]|uniref:(Mediterranean fruit fly) hypothetical protein n=1 Tax=Ceratitis capitata TaxID=7213 RepID=A0A811V9S8_CERCA|nr:unnamed protein product [Ceratitis capitata]
MGSNLTYRVEQPTKTPYQVLREVEKKLLRQFVSFLSKRLGQVRQSFSYIDPVTKNNPHGHHQQQQELYLECKEILKDSAVLADSVKLSMS